MRSLKLLVSVVVIGLLFSSVVPALADTSLNSVSMLCSSFSGAGTTDAPYVAVAVYIDSGGGTLYYDVQPNSSGHFSFHATFDQQPEGTLLEYYVWGSTNIDGTWDYQAYFLDVKKCKADSSSGEAGPIADNLLDGRINRQADLDVAAPVAIYQDAQKTVSIWAIDPATGNGTQGVNLPWSAIDAVGVPTDTPIVLSDTTVNGLHILVSRLTTGEIQVNVTGNGANYIVVWSPDHPEALYHLSA